MLLKKQILVNLFSNVLAMGTSMLISLWITPYLILKLGLAAYGYVGLINSITNFMAVITFTLTSMVARFLTVSLEKNGPQEASKYVSSALIANIFLGAMFLPLFLLLGYNLESVLDLQNEYIVDVSISFILSGIAFIFNSIYLVFSTGPYNRNRLDITNGITIFSNIVRAVFLVSIFSLFSAQIWLYALSSVLQVTIALILGIFAFRSLLPDIQLKLKLFNFKMSFELVSSGLYNSVILLGKNFITQIDLIVGNRYLPADIVGMYAAILLIPNSIRNIAVALSYAFSPTTVMLYSSGNMDELRNYSNKVVKFCGLLIGWPISIIGGLAIPILKLWLRADYSPYEFTIAIMLQPLTVHLSVNQLYVVQQAMNKVKIPALASIILGIMNIFLAIFFTASLKMGIFGIVLSGVIMNTIRTVFFMPIYTAIITNQSKFAYYKSIIFPFFIALLTYAIGILMQKFITINSLFSLLFSALFLSIFYFAISIGSLGKEERKLISQKAILIVRR